MVIFLLRSRPEYHLVTRLHLILRTAASSEQHGYSNTWIVMNLRTDCTHLPCPRHHFLPHSSTAARSRLMPLPTWIIYTTWSLINTHFPRRFAETSRRFPTNWRQSMQRCIVKMFASDFFSRKSAEDFYPRASSSVLSVCQTYAYEKSFRKFYFIRCYVYTHTHAFIGNNIWLHLYDAVLDNLKQLKVTLIDVTCDLH